MIDTIRIIHLEDDIFSTVLIQALLAEEGLPCELERVETESEFSLLLERGGYDLVLASSTLPACDGMTALARSRERRPGLPFIFVTGALGEEVAIESLKSGAADYVLKGRLSRLAPAVQRVLREAEDNRNKLRRAKEAQWRSEQLFVNALMNAVTGMCLTRIDGSFLIANDLFCDMLGYAPAELAGMTVTDLTHPDDLAASRQLAEALLSQGIPAGSLEKRYLHKDGGIVWAWETVFLHRCEDDFPLYLVAQVREITEEKKLESRLRHAQKMEAIGRLTGGMVHNFNNLLLVILGHGSLLARKLPEEGPLADHVQQILMATDRATQLTNSLLAFSRDMPLELREVNLNEIVTRVERLIAAAVREDVERVTNLSDRVLTVLGDAGQLEQVLMNLITNAWDAMPQRGALRITTGITDIDRAFIAQCGFGEPGVYALLTVSDNGTGMDDATRKKIFEPFFTTKESGKGTGLGLSIAYGVVKQHNGFIDCCSEPGRGTTFSIYLPLIGEMGSAGAGGLSPGATS